MALYEAEMVGGIAISGVTGVFWLASTHSGLLAYPNGGSRRVTGGAATSARSIGFTNENNLNAVELVTGLLQAELAEFARTEVYALLPPGGQLDETFSPRFVTQLLSGGLKVRVLRATEPGSGEQLSPQHLLSGAVAITDVRLPHPIVVRDQDFVYLPHPSPSNDSLRRLMRVRSAVLGRAICGVFDVVWSMSAGSATTRPSADAVNIGTEEREVLHMLSRGITDERAAAYLHVSKRTFARKVAAVMSLLGTSSRFRAGAEAVRRGWL